MTEPTWLTVAQAAKQIGLDRATVYRLIAQKRIKHYRIGTGGGKIVFRAPDLDAYVASCAVEVGDPGDAFDGLELEYIKTPGPKSKPKGRRG